MSVTESAPRPDSKVARVIEKYALEGWGDRLEAEWTGERGDRTSLRDLATEFNHAVLRAAINRAGSSIADSDLASAYQTLTGDDVSRGDELRKHREFESMDVDVEDVQSDFVTHQAVHSYLTKYRGAELPDQPDSMAERKAETLERLQGRTSAVAESTLERLTANGELEDHEYDVVVDVRAICRDCGSDFVASDLLRRGGCPCDAGA